VTCPSRLAFWLAAGAIPIVFLACGRSTQTPDAGTVTGSGGSTAGAGQADAPGMGGGLATGGVGTGGAQASGGELGSGGSRADAGTAGGGPGSGGESRLDGSSGAAGSTGGAIAGSGGASGRGGATGTGGKTVGSGGLSGPGGSATGGHTTGSGGTVSDGGGSVDSSSGLVTFPPKFFGNIDTSGSIRPDFAGMWDQFSPENAGKWESVQATASTFDWTRLDAMYKYCDDNRITFKQQTFIWGNAGPAWINKEIARTAAPAWMKAFCDRYPKTRLVNVVAQPIHTRPSYVEGLGGTGASGYDWIAQSLVWAREACPNAVLLVSDFNIIEYSTDHDKFIQLVKAVKELGAPITAVGAEGHEAYKVSGSTVASLTADIVSQTGLPVYITELDIGVADDTQQATIMRDLVTTFWNNPNVLGITYWGYVVGKTWRDNTGLMQSDGTRRPALTWLMDFLGR
jgi:endo-1,4-beta-xylanase